jgi:hypothetical protein
VGDDQHRARIFAQMLFQPGGGLRVEVVGRLIEQQKVGLAQQKLAERDAALSPPDSVSTEVAGRAAQRISIAMSTWLSRSSSGCRFVLQLGGLVGGLVAVVRHQLVVAIDRLLLGDAEHDVALDVERRIELRLLRQVAGGRPRPARLRR